jgi:hypothetical protein
MIEQFHFWYIPKETESRVSEMFVCSVYNSRKVCTGGEKDKYYMCVCVCVCVYIYIYTHTHIYI